MKKTYLIIVMVITMLATVMCAVANNLVLNDTFKKALGFFDGDEGGKSTLLFCLPLYFGQLAFNASAIIAAVRVLPTPEKGVRVAGAMIIVMNVMTVIFSATVLIAALKTNDSALKDAAALLLKIPFSGL